MYQGPDQQNNLGSSLAMNIENVGDDVVWEVREEGGAMMINEDAALSRWREVHAGFIARMEDLLEDNGLVKAKKTANAKNILKGLKMMKMGKTRKDCTVCTNRFNEGEKIRLLPCKHIFHDGCLRPWLEQSTTCPNCRLDLLAATSTATNAKGEMKNKKSEMNFTAADDPVLFATTKPDDPPLNFIMD